MSIRSALFFLSLSCLPACLSTIDSHKLQSTIPVPRDETYNKVYQESSQQFDFVQNFETKYKVTVSHLTPNLRQAIAARYERIFQEPQPLLTEASQKTAFFVTLYAKNRELTDLTDERLWSLQLRTGTTVLKPSIIKPVKPKDRWQIFFPDINIWSNEYLVIFDQQPSSAQPDSVSAESEFILASPEGSITTRW